MIPPFIDEEVAKRGTPEQREAARKRLQIAVGLRARRALRVAQAAQTPGQRTRKTYTTDNTETLPGRIVRDENGAETGDAATDEAHGGAGATWQMYKDFFGRDSLDNEGLVLVSTVHYGQDFDNAFWSGEQMAYGDGDLFARFTADPTVIGHELTHGVTQFSAGLIYQGQPGALNEHLSDVFGSLMEQVVKGQTVDHADWLIGAELFAGTSLQGRALRDMRNPGTAYDDPLIGKDPQPAHMDDLYTGWQDNGGVHINSGIPNRAYHLAAMAYGGWAVETVGPIWYRVLTGTLISPTATFQEFADATVVAALDLGINTAQLISSWAEVGITVGEEPVPIPEPSPCALLAAHPLMEAILGDSGVAAFIRQLDRRARAIQRGR